MVGILAIAGAAHAQEYLDTLPTLTVQIVEGSQYVYVEDGYAVMAGEVENTGMSPVADVRIQASFFDATGALLEVAEGGTALDVIPAGSKSPFAVRTNGTIDGVTDASARFATGFKASADKAGLLAIYSTDVDHGESFRAAGEVRSGGAPERDVRAHAALHDGFGRVLRVHTFELGDMLPNSRAQFEVDGLADTRGASLVLYAESESSYAPGRALVEVPAPGPSGHTSSARITDVSVDGAGPDGTVQEGTIATITADVEHTGGPATGYNVYVQISESERGAAGTLKYIVYVDGETGRLGSDGSVSVEWVADRTGLFNVETFIWDPSGIPLGNQGPLLFFPVG